MNSLNKKSLFWDVEIVDPQKNEKFIIERILSRGDKSDFFWAFEFYGEDKIKKYLIEGRNIDKKSLFFWCWYFNLNSKECIRKQSTKKQKSFWKK